MPKEFDMIDTYFKSPFAAVDIPVGIGDDAAVLPPSEGLSWVVAVDTLNEGVHFFKNAPAAMIAEKALRVNLSDMAAMGALPKYFTLSLALPFSDEPWIKSFSARLQQLAAQYEVALIGGDTTKGPLSISIQMLGQVPAGKAILRSGAKVGDTIWVTGYLGDAAEGLALLKQKQYEHPDFEYFEQAYYQPEPQLIMGNALKGLANSAIDISDGFLADLNHILKASSCGATINQESIPVSEPLKKAIGKAKAQKLALSSGDDYQLCFTLPQALSLIVKETAKALGVIITQVGEVTEGKRLSLHLNGKEQPYDQCGFEHFTA